MDDSELAKHTTCDNCHALVTATGLPLFWRVTIERFGIDAQKLRSGSAMSSIVGHYGIAKAMGI